MDFIMNTLTSFHPINEPHLLAGCRMKLPKWLVFRYPYGGYGTILTRKAIENLIRPIYCDTKSVQGKIFAKDGFNRKACWRLNQNLIGEQLFFHDGSSSLYFTKAHEWKNGIGYCFHSDHTLGYFIGFYHIAVPDNVWSTMAIETDIFQQRSHYNLSNDKLRLSYGYEDLKENFVSCKFSGENCSDEPTICHYVSPKLMYDIYNNYTLHNIGSL
jgi:hypothetical protein